MLYRSVPEGVGGNNGRPGKTSLCVRYDTLNGRVRNLSIEPSCGQQQSA